jgi:membrane protein
MARSSVAWRDVWIGAALTAILFAVGKLILGLYLGSGAAGAAYGAASSLITLLLWTFHSAQILLFGAEFTQVYANPTVRMLSRRNMQLSWRKTRSS